MGTTPISDEDLHAYFDGELTPERRAEVEAWLATRPDAARQLEDWQAQASAIKAAYDPIFAEPLPEQLSALGSRQPAPAKPTLKWLTAAAAGVALFAAGFSSARLLQPAPAAPQETLAEYGLEAHTVYVGEVRHPVEVGVAEEEHLVRWLSKRLDAPLVVPNLAADGLSLVGGRLLPAAGKPCAMLMYETTAGERFTLLVVNGTGNGDTAFRYQEAGGYGAFYWYEGKFGYALTGPADKARLLGISRRVYETLS